MQTNQKYKIIDRDLIKFIAIIPMAIGHFVDHYFGASASLINSPLLFLIAQASMIAPPIFFYFIAEGFTHTHSVKKYAARLFIFALITQIPFCLMLNGTLMLSGMITYLNVFFTLFLGLVALIVCGSNMKLWAKISLVAVLEAVTYFVTDTMAYLRDPDDPDTVLFQRQTINTLRTFCTLQCRQPFDDNTPCCIAFLLKRQNGIF
ncbi:TraX family protein [Ruminococcus albus]|uniref:TraX family protein n=1 Tax=Ruminococcus albus TaxID=1264 RepID=UPI000463673B|nr:TraX family protein [Ruminococcus albus]